MPAQENIQSPQEDLFIVKADAVHDNEIVIVIRFDFRTLLLFR